MCLSLIVTFIIFATVSCSDGGEGDRTLAKTTVEDAKEDGLDICWMIDLPPGCDVCAEVGWYGDGICDLFCDEPDQDCACGGPSGLDCEVGSYCDYSDSAGCGADSEFGVCVRIPGDCTYADLSNPVCGCDGETYISSCQARMNGVDIASVGACDNDEPRRCGSNYGLCEEGEYCDYPDGSLCGAYFVPGVCVTVPNDCTLADTSNPVCGCDGETYVSSCQANRAGVDVASRGACESDEPRYCGGVVGLLCEDDEYCDYDDDLSCGYADEMGICRPRPDACSAVDPASRVCGCDGDTYVSSCHANLNGVDVASDGACDGDEPRYCGEFVGLSCEEDEFCDYDKDQHCGTPDAVGTCLPRPSDCSGEDSGSRVCGCDGETYESTCQANMAGVDVLSEGACESETPRVCGPGLDECGDDEFCEFENNDCGRSVIGTCRLRPADCNDSDSSDFVCGCDGESYSNTCAARINGVDYYHDEDCSELPIEDCRVTGCEEDEHCKLCFGTYSCIPTDVMC